MFGGSGVEGQVGAPPRGRHTGSLGQSGPRKGEVLKGQGVARPVPALAPCAPDGVRLRQARYRTRKPRVTTSVPSTTHTARDTAIVSWSWVLSEACAARGKTGYFKSWLPGKLLVQGQALDPGCWGGGGGRTSTNGRGTCAGFPHQRFRLCGSRSLRHPQHTRTHTGDFFNISIFLMFLN